MKKIILGAVLACGLSARAGEVPLRETAQGAVFGTERFAVRFDPQTGWAGEVLCDGRVVVQAAPAAQAFDIQQDAGWVTGGGAPVVGGGVARVAPDTVRGRMTAGEWTVDAFVQLDPQARTLRRWFDITWQGGADTKIRNFWFQGGVLPVTEKGGYLLPASYPPRRTAAAEFVPDRRASSGRSPYPVVAETGGGWSAVWVTDELQAYSDRGGAGVQEGAGDLRVTQSFGVQGHVRRGVPQRVGDAWLWLQPNDAETALRRLPEWFARVGQVPPEGRPDWLKRVILYSLHPGGTIGSNCKDLGGFQAAAALLPRIQSLGCNAVWLMPLEDKSIYWPRDYYKLQEGIGTPEDFKAFTARAHALDMRVWQDCVPHGGCNEYPRAKEHPEWLAQNEDGSTLHYWCFDFNWPGWIDYMRGVVSFYTREYALDGFRIDACGGSKIPNWNPAIPYARASHAQAQGGFAMQRALREEVRKIRPDGANLAEVGASVHGAVSDSTYDFDLCYNVLHDFRKSPPEVFVPRLRRWLHEQQCAEVPDLVRMRHVESHDSLRSGLWYGADAQRALVALTAWIHGIPLVYHEMEDGNEAAYRRIFSVRRRLPELNTGAADYLGVDAPDGVFACLRTGAVPVRGGSAWHDDYLWDAKAAGAGLTSVVLVNLNGQTVRGAVSAPEALRGAAWVRDMMTGEKLAVRGGCVEVALAPFGHTVLRVESPALPALKPLPATWKPTAVAAAPIAKRAKVGPLVSDAKKGPNFAHVAAWQGGWWKEFTLRADLAVPESMKPQISSVWFPESGSSMLHDQVMFGDSHMKSYYRETYAGDTIVNVLYREVNGGVEVQGGWTRSYVSNNLRHDVKCDAPKGAALLLELPEAESWFADTAEGRFESPFRVRHPAFDGTVGSIYRLPQGTATLWDSRVHPFGLDAAHARVGVMCGKKGAVVFEFDPVVRSPPTTTQEYGDFILSGAEFHLRLPASVRLLDRIGDDHGLKMLIEWPETEGGSTNAVRDAMAFMIRNWTDTAAEPGTGDPRLTVAGGGWVFENDHYRARIARTGVLTGLWRKDGAAWRTVAEADGLYTDKGFGGDKTRYAQENDVEAAVRIERAGEGIRLVFTGELRGNYRFDKMGAPVRFASAYCFDNGPAFRRSCGFSASAPVPAAGAFLSLKTRVEGAERVAFGDAAGEFLAGVRGDGRARYAETAKAAEPGRVPSDIRVSGADGAVLRLADLVWSGA
ncbi:MAG: hypothetical protein LBW77_06530, partial [Verrucomicrobiota bacterium]|nr:hypothetical protein [Verrucomicrobiota bacterium]